MAQQQRAMAAEVVDVAVAIDVPLMRPLGALDENAVGVDIAGVVRDAAREQIAGVFCELLRARRPLPIGGDDAGVGPLTGGNVVHVQPRVRSCLP